MKKALVLGAGGFIGSHLVKRLKEEGFWVRGVDLKLPEHWPSKADEFVSLLVNLKTFVPVSNLGFVGTFGSGIKSVPIIDPILSVTNLTSVITASPACPLLLIPV